jgi:hypothetical protein
LSFYSHYRYVQRLFAAQEDGALAAQPAAYDSTGHEERDANSRFKLLLDIQDAFSLNSGLVTTFSAGSKEYRDCFSGTSFMRWLRDEGGKHLTEHSVDFSHEGENNMFPSSLLRLFASCARDDGCVQECCRSLRRRCLTSTSCARSTTTPVSTCLTCAFRSSGSHLQCTEPRVLTIGCSESSSHDATGLSLYRFAKDESEEYIEKHQVIRDSLAKQLHHNSQGSGSMHRSSSARQESDTVTSGSIGEIDFRGVIMLRLIGCKDLAKGGNYARFTLGKQSLKSKSVGSSSNPVFNEVLMLSWDGRARLRGVVYSTSLFGKDEEIGNVDVNLAERSSFENLPLQPMVTACFSRFVFNERAYADVTPLVQDLAGC